MTTRPTYEALGLSVPVTQVIDPKLWMERYAWGVSMGGGGSLVARAKAIAVAQAGRGAAAVVEKIMERVFNEIPPRVIQWHLRAALSELEMKLGMPMGLEIVKSDPVDADERLGETYDREAARLPYTHAEAGAWFRIDLPPGVIRVDRVRGYYYGTKVWELSTKQGTDNMIRLEWGRQGVMHILPINMQAIIVTQGGNYGIWHTIHTHQSPVPDFWSVDYVRGPVSKHGGAVGQLEAVLAHWVYCTAGQVILSMAGIAASKGLASTSLSIDGVSRSVGLQASAIYGLNSALEHMLDEATKRIDWKRVRAQKRGLRLRMY